MTGLIYIEGETVLEKIEEEGKKPRIGQIDKKVFENLIKTVDYVPFLEMCYDIIEFTKEYEDSTKKASYKNKRK